MNVFWDFIERVSHGLHRMWISVFENLRSLAGLFAPGGATRAINPALHHPFRLLLGTCLFLALTIAGVTADDPNALWRLWLPVPFALFVIFVGLFDQAPLYRVRGLIGLMAGLGVVLVVRGWHAVQLPIPFLAVRETIQLTVSLLLLTAFWLTAGRRPKLAQAVMIASFAVVGAVRYFISPLALIFRPDLLVLAFSIPWGFILLGGVLASKNPAARWHGRRWRPSIFLLVIFHLAAIAAGGAAAWFCMGYVRAFSIEETVLARRAEEAVQALWSGSVLFGWGYANLSVIAKAMMEPASITIPNWTGPFGFLSAHGLLGAIAAGCFALATMWLGQRRRERERLGLGAPSVLALLVAQAILAFFVTGGPQSSLPFLVYCVWLGIGLAPNRRGRDLTWHTDASPVEFGLIRGFAALGAFAVFLLLAGVTVGPVWTRTYLRSLREIDFQKQERLAALAKRLHLAMTLSPWDAQCYVNEGRRLRELITQNGVENWDESLYGRAIDAYEQARRLDPYDVNVIMEYSRVQRLAGRHEEAQETIERGLAATPRNEDLLSYAYFVANSDKDAGRALEVIRRALAARPYAALWWGRRFDAETALGNGPEAGFALNVELTGNPEDPKIINLTARRRAAVMETAAVGAQPAGSVAAK